MDFIEFITNKRVVLVGPSPSIIGERRGLSIDAHDIVVRMNKAIPVPAKLASDIGTKTDILYNCLEPHPNSGGQINIKLWKDHKVQWVCSPYPILKFSVTNIKRFIHLNNQHKKKMNFRCVNSNLYKTIATETQTRPNTGLLAICDLLSFPIKSLLITGMTFGKDGYYKEYSNMSLKNYHKMANGANHQQYPQFEYFCTLAKHDARIVPDSVLQEMMR